MLFILDQKLQNRMCQFVKVSYLATIRYNTNKQTTEHFQKTAAYPPKMAARGKQKAK